MIAVAIDGPVGAGKSTLARKAAEALGFLYVDTGACYRGVAYYCIKHEIDPNNSSAVGESLEHIQLRLQYNEEGQQRVIVNGEDISEEIRSPEVSDATSIVASIPKVREWLLDLQREIAREHNVVMDGRDIGTVVLPLAEVKIFLTAAPEERAKRRHQEYLVKAENISYNEVLEALKARDERDSQRAIAPLRQAEDAILIDSTGLDFDQTLKVILKTIKDRNESNVL